MRRAEACCNPGGGPEEPAYPVYFLHTDHLGSTLALGCHKQTNGCADRTVHRYYRYSAYGEMKAYDSGGAALPATQAPTVDRLYTGQVWDSQAQMYYYNARFYDPKVARFMTMDPAREQANPYAYVAWNPVAFTDPTGMVLGFSGIGATINAQLAGPTIADLGWVALLRWRGTGRGGFNGPGGGGPGGGAGQNGLLGPGSGSLASELEGFATQAVMVVYSGLAEEQGKPHGMTLQNPSLNSSPASPPEGPLSMPSLPGVSLLSLWEGPLGQISRAYATQTGGYVDVSFTAPIGKLVGFVSGVMLTANGFHTYHGLAVPGFGGASVTLSGYAAAPGGALAASAFAPAGGQVGLSWSAADLANFSFGAWQFFAEVGYGLPPGAALSALAIGPQLSYDGPRR